MNVEFDYRSVPDSYLHCSNQPCLQSVDCLRYLAFQHIPEDQPHVCMVNPAYIARQKTCPYFRSNTPIRFALGITRLFDNLPHIKAQRVKRIIHDYFEHNTYYRIYNKKYMIKPESQEFIRSVFLSEDITEEPVFDEYLLLYDWTDHAKIQATKVSIG